MADAATIAAVVAGIGGVMLGNVDVVTDERRTQVATVSLQRCEKYAPAAPAETLIEAAVQMSGYLIGTAANLHRRSITDPSGTAMELESDAQATRNAFRYSRASALLAPYRVLRAGVIA